VKEVSDLLAQRGGQALGSLLILICLTAAAPTRWIGGVVMLCAAAWIWMVLGLRLPYLRLFRETLNEASADIRLDFPELDMGSLETLLAALNSPDEARVIAALDLLAATGRVHVIPALILYHPAPAVVARALELFAAVGRADFVPFAPGLIRHPDATVRATVIRAWAKVEPDAEPLQRAIDSSCPIGASMAIIAAAARGAIAPEDAVGEVRKRLSDEGAADDPRPFVARALRDTPLPAFAPLVIELAAAADAGTRREAIQALGALGDRAHLPLLIEHLAEAPLREAVARTLLAYGDAALDALAAALRDEARPYALRVHVPRAIARFGHQRAADLLLDALRVEPGGRLRYKLLRALGRLMTEVRGLALDAEVLDRIAEDHLAQAFPNLHWVAVLEEAAEEVPARRTVGHRLLVELLKQRQAFAVERLFRVLGLRVPDEDFAQIYDSVHGDDPATRAAGRELLEHLLPARWRAAVLALIDDAPAADRLASAAPYYVAGAIEYDALVRELAAHASDAVAALATYHGMELGVVERASDRVLDTSVNWIRGWRQPVSGGAAPDQRGAGARGATRRRAGVGGGGASMTTPETIGPVERALWLRAVWPFTSLRARPLAALARLMREDVVPAGGAIVPVGRGARSVRLLVEGRLRARGTGEATDVLEAPQVIGLTEMLAGRELRVALAAETDATILTIPGAAFSTCSRRIRAGPAAPPGVRAGGCGSARGARRLGAGRVARGIVGAASGPRSAFVDRMLALHRVPMLREFGVAVLATLLRDEPVRQLAAGDTLFAAGSPAERIAVIADGAVVGTAASGATFRAGPGTMLGDNEALTGVPYAYTAVCEAPAA
jgi:HEAT repeat protein/CRP-like cAMP-binding protein